MRTVGWVDPAAEVKENKLEQAEEPAAEEEKKPAKKAASKKK